MAKRHTVKKETLSFKEDALDQSSSESENDSEIEDAKQRAHSPVLFQPIVKKKKMPEENETPALSSSEQCLEIETVPTQSDEVVDSAGGPNIQEPAKNTCDEESPSPNMLVNESICVKQEFIEDFPAKEDSATNCTPCDKTFEKKVIESTNCKSSQDLILRDSNLTGSTITEKKSEVALDENIAIPKQEKQNPNILNQNVIKEGKSEWPISNVEKKIGKEQNVVVKSEMDSFSGNSVASNVHKPFETVCAPAQPVISLHSLAHIEKEPKDECNISKQEKNATKGENIYIEHKDMPSDSNIPRSSSLLEDKFPSEQEEDSVLPSSGEPNVHLNSYNLTETIASDQCTPVQNNTFSQQNIVPYEISLNLLGECWAGIKPLSEYEDIFDSSNDINDMDFDKQIIKPSVEELEFCLSLNSDLDPPDITLHARNVINAKFQKPSGSACKFSNHTFPLPKELQQACNDKKNDTENENGAQLPPTETLENIFDFFNQNFPNSSMPTEVGNPLEVNIVSNKSPG